MPQDTLAPNLAAVAVNDPLYGGQAHAVAGELPLRVEALERPEQLRDVGHVEAGPVVPHEEGRRPLVPLPSHHDGRGRLLRGELPRVAEEVFEGHAQKGGVADGGKPRLDDESDRAVGFPAAQLGRDPLGQGRQVHGFPFHLAPVDSGQQEHVVNELPHPLRARAQPSEVVLPPVVELSA